MRRWLNLVGGLVLIALLALAGDIVARRFPIGVPGPIVGFALFAMLLKITPPLRAFTAAAADRLIMLMGAFIVPAAVGLVLFEGELRAAAWPLAAVLVVSTLVTGVVTAFAYQRLAR